MKLSNLLRYLKRGQKSSTADLNTANNTVDSNNRALEWLGKDFLDRQKFYEKWSARENWLVYDEGLCLLLGRDPEDKALGQDADFVEQRKIFWDHLQRCVSQRVPPTLSNPAAESNAWRVEPVELYRWAVAARVPMPAELEEILAFISSTVPARSAVQPKVEVNDESIDNSELMAREQVLSIMLSLSLQAQYNVTQASPDKMREHILNDLYACSRRYFNSDEPPLSRPALHDLIDRSLEHAGLIHMTS